MKAGIAIAVVLFTIAAAASFHAQAGVVGQSGVPNTTGGILVTCSNPLKILSVVRTEDATTVIQSGPGGVNWQVDLPPMQLEFDQFLLAPDGSAAVITTDWRPGNAFLVSEGRTTTLDHAPFAVDFQSSRVLIATAPADGSMKELNHHPWMLQGTRVRVYELPSMRLVGDTTFNDIVVAEVDRGFFIRLAEDGDAYYYVQAPMEGAPGGPVVRNVKTGNKHMPGTLLPNGEQLSAFLQDMVMASGDRGYLAGGGLHVLGGDVLEPIPVPDTIGHVTEMTLSDDGSRLAVEGHHGWGILDTDSRRWLLTDPDEYADLSFGNGRWIAMLDTSTIKHMTSFDLSGTRQTQVRTLSGDMLSYSRRACQNAYGVLSFENGKFKWYRTEPG